MKSSFLFFIYSSIYLFCILNQISRYKMTKYAIILGGGSGLRFGSSIPKQFLLLGGMPVMMRSIMKFFEADAFTHIIVVLPEAQIEYWQELCAKYDFNISHTVVKGGSSRFESVKNAIRSIDIALDDVIAVHDGVRPLVPIHVIKEAYSVAAQSGSAIPVVKVTDSIRMLCTDGSTVAMDRETLRAVQTPQAFNAKLLRDAYNVDFSPEFTDDASVVEKNMFAVELIDGDSKNIKITHSSDLLIAEELLRANG